MYKKTSRMRLHPGSCFSVQQQDARNAEVDQQRQGVDKMYGPIASVAALTAQPLAALPPYGCGVPLAGSERHGGWQVIGQRRRP